MEKKLIAKRVTFNTLCQNKLDIDTFLSVYEKIKIFDYIIDKEHYGSLLTHYLNSLMGSSKAVSLEYIDNEPMNTYHIYDFKHPVISFEEYVHLKQIFLVVDLYATGDLLEEYKLALSKYKEPTSTNASVDKNKVEPTVKKELKIYVASSFDNKAGASLLADYLEANGFHVTSHWLRSPGVGFDNITKELYEKCPQDCFKRLKYRAETDYTDIDNADVLVFMYPYGYGTSSELGYALAKNKPILALVSGDHFDDLPLPMGLALTRDPYCLFSDKIKLVEALRVFEQCKNLS